MHTSACLLLLAAFMWPQSTDESDKAAIQRAQNLLASSLDGRLPKVSLKFFLEYEATGAPVTWSICDCGGSDKARNSGDTTPICVEADFDPNNRTTVSVIVSLVSAGEGSGTVPAFLRGTVSNMAAVERTVHRLGDLPMELQRPKSRLPHELPLPAGASFRQRSKVH